MNGIVLALLVIGSVLVQGSQTDSGMYLTGKPDSPVRIEIFSDLECPACRTFFLDTVVPLLDQYSSGNRVAVIFHDFPLPAHASSRTASLYSLASRSLGREQAIKAIKYLYTCQAEWAYDGNIDRVLARALSPAEMAQVRDKLKDPAVEQTVNREVELGNKRKVESTPTFFVTTQGKEQRVVGGLPFSVLNGFIAPGLK
jgi:protein-disulfide isomerase